MTVNMLFYILQLIKTIYEGKCVITYNIHVKENTYECYIVPTFRQFIHVI